VEAGASGESTEITESAALDEKQRFKNGRPRWPTKKQWGRSS